RGNDARRASLPAHAGLARPRPAGATGRPRRPPSRGHRHPRRRAPGGGVALSLPDPAAKAAAVRTMFDPIAPRSPPLNTTHPIPPLGPARGGRRAAAAAAAGGAGDLLVDVGCGPGELAALAAAAGARVVGIDVAPAMLAHARGRGAMLVRADAAQLPVRAAT